jgi:hypothetical protein
VQHLLSAAWCNAKDRAEVVRAAFLGRAVEFADYLEQIGGREFAIGSVEAVQYFRAAVSRDAKDRSAPLAVIEDRAVVRTASAGRAVERAIYLDQRGDGISPIGFC